MTLAPSSSRYQSTDDEHVGHVVNVDQVVTATTRPEGQDGPGRHHKAQRTATRSRACLPGVGARGRRRMSTPFTISRFASRCPSRRQIRSTSMPSPTSVSAARRGRGSAGIVGKHHHGGAPTGQPTPAANTIGLVFGRCRRRRSGRARCLHPLPRPDLVASRSTFLSFERRIASRSSDRTRPSGCRCLA